MTDTQTAPTAVDPPQGPSDPGPMVPADESPQAPASGPLAYLRLAGLLVALVVVAYFWPWLFVVIIGLMVMITLHEFGHYYMAKRAGMKVTEFFLCFGPRLWSFRRGETEYGIKLIPAGAYVRIIGMSNLEEVPAEDEARTYRQKSVGQRLGVAVAGSTMHFLLAIGLIFVLLVGFGTPGGKDLATVNQGKAWEIGTVIKSSAAADAGIKAGDRLLSIGGHRISTWDDVQKVVPGLKNKVVEVRYERGHEVITKRVKLHNFLDELGYTACCLGVGAQPLPNQRTNPVAAVPKTVQSFAGTAQASVQGFVKLFSLSGLSNYGKDLAHPSQTKPVQLNPAPLPKAPHPGATRPPSSNDTSSAQRPISILGIASLGGQLGSVGGVEALIGFFAVINIFIGLFNLIPLLPFDGGHVAIAIYEWAQEKRLHRTTRYFADVSKMMPLTYAVVTVLGLLFFSSMYLDIVSPVVK